MIRSRDSDFRISFARCGSRAFTLIELLAVVAIIGILAALLFPSINGIKAKSMETKCLSNLRQMQSANIAYANDHQGVFVPVSSGTTNWYSDSEFRTILDVNTATQLVQLPSNLMCPGAVKDKVKIGYGYNWEGLPTSSAQKNDNTGATVRAGRTLKLIAPASTIAFIDGLDWQVNMGGSSKYNGTTVSQGSDCAYRHRNGAQIVSWDGHAEFLPRASLDVSVNPDNAKRWKFQE